MISIIYTQRFYSIYVKMHKLSIAIPVYNEYKNLDLFFERLFQVKLPIAAEWIVINDASTDGSKEKLEELKGQYGFTLVHLEKNLGKGGAIRKSLTYCTGSLFLIQDADFEYDPKDIPLLLDPILSGEADVVYGSRFKRNGLQVHRTFHYFINRFLTFLSNLCCGIYLTDMETGYKVFKMPIIQSMKLLSNKFGIEIELTAYLARTNARIFEIPIRYYPRNKLQGKKINWKDGFAALWHLVRFNFLIKDPFKG